MIRDARPRNACDPSAGGARNVSTVAPPTTAVAVSCGAGSKRKAAQRVCHASAAAVRVRQSASATRDSGHATATQPAVAAAATTATVRSVGAQSPAAGSQHGDRHTRGDRRRAHRAAP